MPRRTRSKLGTASSVTSHTAHPLKTPEENGVEVFDSKADVTKIVKGSPNDPMMIGYVYSPAGVDTTKTPYDFLNDPRKPQDKEVKRNGQRVFGIRLIDLQDGIEDIVLPPQAIWKMGVWWGEMPKSEIPFKPNSPMEAELLGDQAWVVDGQGTPGAYLYNVYILPWEKSKTWETPKHPLLWGISDRIGKAKSQYVQEGNGTRSGGGYTSAPPPPSHVVKAVPTTKASSLPMGVRFRCFECGHWFKENDLKAHPQCCPGGINSVDGHTSDWAVMCDKECGCEVHFGAMLGDKTLDHVGQCKPGFPRPKPKKKKEVKAVSAVSATEAEPTPEEPKEGEEATPDEAEAPEAPAEPAE